MKWGEVVESDRICVADRWYVVQSQAPSEGMVHVRAKSEVTGKVGTFKRLATDDVPASDRGPTGAAVDLFKIVFSGPTRPAEVVTKGAGPMLGEREEDE